jgi:ParB family chromosome partitioning protein
VAKTSKFGLGKGLDALLPPDTAEDAPAVVFPARDGARAASEDAVLSLPLAKIRANPSQPRAFFDEAALDELAASIKEYGVIQPVIVEADRDGWTLIAGERRCRAASRAGLSEIPAIVRGYSAEKRVEIALIENIQRTDLNPIEEALAYKSLIDLTGVNQDELAAKVGKNRSTVANALRLLRLPVKIQKSLETGEISSGHARALLSISDATMRERIFNEIVIKGLSVREAEKIAGNTDKPAKPAPVKLPAARDPHIVALEEELIEALGTKVRIEGGLAKGMIRIEYYSMEDLDRIYKVIKE